MLKLGLSVFICICSMNSAAFAQATPQLRPYISFDERTFILANVTVYDGSGKSVLKAYDVQIRDGVIDQLKPHGTMEISKPIPVFDFTGHTLLPGIVGMHNHLHMPGNSLLRDAAPKLYLASGVTTIATAGSADAFGELALADAIKLGEVPGPQIFPSAPYLTGIGGNGPMSKPKDQVAAIDFVDRWAKRGVKRFKLYRHIHPDMARVIIREAHKRGLKVTGHLCSLTYEEAAQLGIDSIEHGLNPATDFVATKRAGQCVPSKPTKMRLALEDNKLRKLIHTLVRHQVTLTSTLAIIESGFAHRPQGDNRAYSALAPTWAKQYDARQSGLKAEPERAADRAYWRLLLAFERAFVAAGGHLVAGPDTGRHVLPGYGDQRNFELLVEAGFSVPEVVKIMTHNGAQTLGIGDHTGLIKPGYCADLMLVRGDLTQDAANIENVILVVKDGLIYDPAKLTEKINGAFGPE
jgi:imidazolonepropionase-like amidohydrolase